MLSKETHHLLDQGVNSERLKEKYQQLKKQAASCIGYPGNQAFEFSELLPFFEFALNNIGDPFQDSSYPLNTLDFEREVIDIFAELTGLPHGEHWGYVTNGGTEGNMYGLYLARELHPKGMVYFSEHCHYSVAKILRLQNTPNIMIKAQANGEMDYDDLRESIRINRHLPPIIFANIGTTMTGAIDNLDTIHEILSELAIRESYIHADAAMHGIGLPFIDNPPPWNFSDGIDSISISGHKWLGMPVPSGIALARSQHVDHISRAVEYVGVNDTTITGSRSSISPLMIWHALHRLGRDGLRANISKSLELAEYAVEQFQAKGVEAWRNHSSPIVVFPRPGKNVAKRWALALEKDIGHMICLPHMEKSLVDAFILDYTSQT